MPVYSREEFALAKWPEIELPPMVDPWLGWQHSEWQSAWEEFRTGNRSLPSGAVPVGLDLEEPLRHELHKGNPAAAEALAIHLAFHRRPREALEVLEVPPSPDASRLAGLILWKGLQEPTKAIPCLEAGPLGDPVAAAELDELYAELHLTDKRCQLLTRAPDHRLVRERRADLALALGKPEEALQILAKFPWPREHQRYVRTDLWKRARRSLRQRDVDPPVLLGEDNLARFGAYWSDQ